MQRAVISVSAIVYTLNTRIRKSAKQMHVLSWRALFEWVLWLLQVYGDMAESEDMAMDYLGQFQILLLLL